ncbi:hypothetical protein D3C75_1007490 [compost metagenome]
MSNRLLSSFMSTRPMLPPVILAVSPSSKAPVMVPALISKKSRLSPWASDWRVPPLMTKVSTPLPWFTAPVTWPALMLNVSLPSP